MSVSPFLLILLCVACFGGALFVPNATLSAGSLVAAALFGAGSAICFALDRLRRAISGPNERERRADQIRKEVS